MDGITRPACCLVGPRPAMWLRSRSVHPQRARCTGTRARRNQGAACQPAAYGYLAAGRLRPGLAACRPWTRSPAPKCPPICFFFPRRRATALVGPPGSTIQPAEAGYALVLGRPRVLALLAWPPCARRRTRKSRPRPGAMLPCRSGLLCSHQRACPRVRPRQSTACVPSAVCHHHRRRYPVSRPPLARGAVPGLFIFLPPALVSSPLRRRLPPLLIFFCSSPVHLVS